MTLRTCYQNDASTELLSLKFKNYLAIRENEE